MSKPKVRISRRLGVALIPKATRYMEYPPLGQHDPNPRRDRQSDYARQFTEKQRLRLTPVNIASYQLRPGDVVAVRERSRHIPVFADVS